MKADGSACGCQCRSHVSPLCVLIIIDIVWAHAVKVPLRVSQHWLIRAGREPHCWQSTVRRRALNRSKALRCIAPTTLLWAPLAPCSGACADALSQNYWKQRHDAACPQSCAHLRRLSRHAAWCASA